MILVIDNYDSFVENLARYCRELGKKTIVYRNDKITINKIKELKPSHIILSPGPCTPNEAGICIDIVKEFYKTTPILGVCLGHQAIGQAFGGKIIKAKVPMHGKSSIIEHNKNGVMESIESPTKVARYHSLVVCYKSLPKELEVTSRTKENEIMAFQHKESPTFGVQFHPESVLTDSGYEIIRNFIDIH